MTFPYHPIILLYVPTAGDMEREPVDPVGDGVGLMPELGVAGLVWPLPCPLFESLLLAPPTSCKAKKTTINKSHIYLLILSVDIFF